MSNMAQLSVPVLEDRFRVQFEKKQRADVSAGETLCEIWRRGKWKTKFTDFGAYVNDVLGVSKPTAYRLIGTVDKAVGQYTKKESILKQVKEVQTLNIPTDPETQQTESEDEEYGMTENQDEILIYNIKRAGKDDVKVDQQLEGEMAELFLKYDAQVDEFDAMISQLKLTIERTVKDDPVWSALNISHFRKCIANIKEIIKFARPWAGCPVCDMDGGVRGSCKTCKERIDTSGMDVDDVKAVQKGLKGRGWLVHNQWRTIPEDKK